MTAGDRSDAAGAASREGARAMRADAGDATTPARLEQPRDLPSVHRLVAALRARIAADRAGTIVDADAHADVDVDLNAAAGALASDDGPSDVLYTEAARAAIDAARDILRRPGHSIEADALEADALGRLHALAGPALPPTINATGVVLHTGLGRAVLSADAAQAVHDAARHPVPVEVDRTTGRRGKRQAAVRDRLCRLTGAEAATVVNNGAAALLLALAVLARDRGVAVARGELIEIGGSFRLPDVIEAGGARLCEVGTTNRTRAADFQRAVDRGAHGDGPPIAALLKVHWSNYRIVGFSAEASVAELAAIGRAADIPVVHDIGSGRLTPETLPGMADDEPDAQSSLADGSDLVLFSGDKLLGGPQAGIAVGSASIIAAMDRHPLARALRVDKLVLAGLDATLRLHEDPSRRNTMVPLYRAARAPMPDVRRRAEAIVAALMSGAADEHRDGAGVPGASGHATIAVRRTDASLGGGSTPVRTIPSAAVAIRPHDGDEEGLATRLRTGAIPVMSRLEDGAVVLDLRSVPPSDDPRLTEAIRAALVRGGDSGMRPDSEPPADPTSADAE